MITRRRVLAAVLTLWVVALAYAIQPHGVSRIPVHHAHPLDARSGNMPTLAPYQP